MKKRRVIAAITAIMCCMGVSPLSSAANDPAPKTMIAEYMEENNIPGTVDTHEIDGKEKIVILCENYGDESKVRAYAAQISIDESLLYFDHYTYAEGDFTGDGIIDGRDATAVLTLYAKCSVGAAVVTDEQLKNGDVNRDNILDARDAAVIMTYYAYASTHTEAKYIRTGSVDDDVKYPFMKLINSRKELESYIGSNDNMKEFTAETAEYDDNWFTSHKLMMIVLQESSGSIRHKVMNVGSDSIDINRIVPEVGTCDMAEWHILVELDKDTKIGNEADFRINLSENGSNVSTGTPSDNDRQATADYPCAIKAGGTVFWQTNESFSGDLSKYTVNQVTAYSEKGVPQNDGESNFDRKCTTKYVMIDKDTIAVKMQNGTGDCLIFRAKKEITAVPDTGTPIVTDKITYIRTGSGDDEVEYPYMKLINSRNELDAYIGSNDSMKEFTVETAKYDEEWFASHKIMMIILQESSGSIRHKVLDIGSDHIDIDRIVPEVGTCDMAEWHILVELDKDTEINDEADFRINRLENGKEIKPSVPNNNTPKAVHTSLDVSFDEAKAMFGYPLAECTRSDFLGCKVGIVSSDGNIDSEGSFCYDVYYKFTGGIISISDQDRISGTNSYNMGMKQYEYKNRLFAYDKYIGDSQFTIGYYPTKDKGLAYVAVFDDTADIYDVMDRIIELEIDQE